MTADAITRRIDRELARIRAERRRLSAEDVWTQRHHPDAQWPDLGDEA